MTDPTKAIKDSLEAGPTPGPWIADIPCATEHLWAREAKIRADQWGIVATIGIDTSLPHWDAPQRANAALIAACNPTAIHSLLSRLEEAERDAARYQWLRYCNEKDSGPLFTLGTLSGEMLDAAIDEAMKEQSHG